MSDSDKGHERAATDRGLTGDKVAMGDPAAAPLHTDAEAAGSPTRGNAGMIDRMRRIGGRFTAPFAAHPQPLSSSGPRIGPLLLWAGVLTLVGVAAGLVSVAGL